MSGSVFANTMEISSKSMAGKSICEFPDVCFTPPETPVTPIGVPIPYPNTGMASDTTDGSSSVQIGSEEVMLKDQSNFKSSTGDEAGCAQKKGLMTSTIQGPVYFIAWSMNVMIESENAVRNLDMTTHNHGSKNSTGVVPTVHVAGVAPPGEGNKCQLSTYKPDKCPEGTTGHHLVPDSLFKQTGGKGSARVPGVVFPNNKNGKEAGYDNGLVICLTGQDKAATIPDEDIEELGLDPDEIGKGKDGVRRLNEAFLNSTSESSGRTATMFPEWAGASPFEMTRGEHGRFHKQFDNIVESIGATKPPPCTNTTTFGEQRDVAAGLCNRFFGCKEEDIKKQLDEHYKQFGADENTVMRSSDQKGSQPVDMSVLGNQPNNPCSSPLTKL